MSSSDDALLGSTAAQPRFITEAAGGPGGRTGAPVPPPFSPHAAASAGSSSPSPLLSYDIVSRRRPSLRLWPRPLPLELRLKAVKPLREALIRELRNLR